MIKAGIIGGAGYTAGELFRILLNHPEVEIAFATSNSQEGKVITDIHADLLGETDLVFIKSPSAEVDVLFLCGGHGMSSTFLRDYKVPAGTKIVDLSRDFRLKPDNHGFVYGLPELNREDIRSTDKLANPGCFATCIQLALLPLAKAGKLPKEVHVHGITGATGAGQKPVSTTHFSWRNNNLSTYKAFSHQHLGEIHQSVKQLNPGNTTQINFIPMRGDFPRGIFISAYLDFEGELEEAEELFSEFYEGHPFTHMTSTNPHLKQVVNTNKAILHLEKHGEKLLIISMLDNLLKGASGQAVQNMNLMFGFPEELGLKLKALAF